MDSHSPKWDATCMKIGCIPSNTFTSNKSEIHIKNKTKELFDNVDTLNGKDKTNMKNIITKYKTVSKKKQYELYNLSCRILGY